MNKKCKLLITFFLWDRLITSDNNLRQFYTIFLYHWMILPEASSFFFTLPAILAHLYNWTSGNFPVMQQVPMLTVEQARRQHGSFWRTYRVLRVVLIWSCKYSCLLSLPTTGHVLQERCLHFGLIPVLMYMSFVPDANLFEYLVPGFAANFGPSKVQICTLYFPVISQKKAIRVLNQSELLTSLWMDHDQYRFFLPWEIF